MVPGLDPRVDYAFKKVFGSIANIPVLLDMLEAVLQRPPGQRIVTLEINNPFNEKEAVDDKLSVLDIKARDERGRQYNVEMQMVAPRTYPQRVLYYWSVLHSQQLREGVDYGALASTISVSFVSNILFPQVPDYHLDFQLRSSRHADLVFCEQQSIHVIELPKFGRTAEELTSPLDVWCYFLVHGAELDTDNLPLALRTPPVQRAMEVLQMLTQDDHERERYQARLKGERDRFSYLKDARAEGMEQGLEQGLQQGLARGEVLGRIHLCQRLLKAPLTPMVELTSLPLTELQALAAALEQQLGVRAV